MKTSSLVNQQDVIAPARPDIEFVVMDEAELEKPFRVIIHNDDVTPFDFVIAVLIGIFELGPDQAVDITYEAHHNGLALVTVLPYQEAHRKVYNAHTAARQYGYPLSFTLEPET